MKALDLLRIFDRCRVIDTTRGYRVFDNSLNRKLDGAKPWGSAASPLLSQNPAPRFKYYLCRYRSKVSSPSE